MTISIPTLPADIAADATVTYDFQTAKNTGEGGVSGRKSLRDSTIRQFMLSVAPGPASVEFQNILLACKGQRYPLGMRDYTSYKFTNEVTPFTTTVSTSVCKLQKKFIPSTGSLSYAQRILLLDESEVTLSVTVNGSPYVGSVTYSDFGIVTLGNVYVPGTDIIRCSGQYLIPVCLADMPAATIHRGLHGGVNEVLYGFQSVRFEEILEAELLNLTT